MNIYRVSYKILSITVNPICFIKRYSDKRIQIKVVIILIVGSLWREIKKYYIKYFIQNS